MTAFKSRFWLLKSQKLFLECPTVLLIFRVENIPEHTFVACHLPCTIFNKYQCLKSDIEGNGFACHVVPWEIGARGFVPRRVKLALYSLLRSTTSIKYQTEHIVKLSKISLLCSFSIFHSRREKTWSDPPLLKP